MNKKINRMGWNFDNSYSTLPETFYAITDPSIIEKPKIAILNNKLLERLGINYSELKNEELAQLFSGNILPSNAKSISQAYAGHQFGNFTILGDGRAHLIGEHICPDGTRYDIQLKGSGRTPYSRNGDGKAALGPMLREYIISEAMHSLGIKSSRSLAVIITGEKILRESYLNGAILTRVASSHIRIGTFEYFAALGNLKSLKILADYTIKRHYPKLINSDNPYLNLVKLVMEEQIKLITEWLRVGFIHGVMNTDNMTISGETIDYGPCAFMDWYDPNMVFSSIDYDGRYGFANQPNIVKWNIARFGESLMPLIHKDVKIAKKLIENLISSFDNYFQKTWLAMMRKKLGLFKIEKNDEILIAELLKWMQKNQIDYTNNFRILISKTIPKGKDYKNTEFINWWEKWQIRLNNNGKSLESSFALMEKNNPVIIPRNHLVEEVLFEAENYLNFSKINRFLDILANPYKDQDNISNYKAAPKNKEKIYQTFCGT